MQLMVFITNQASKMPNVLSELMNVGVTGATIVNCEGMLHLLESSGVVEKPAFFGSIRSLFNENEEQGQMMLAVMPDERILDSQKAIERVCGSFKEPNTGIMFTLPVMHFEGVSPKK